MTPSNRLDFKNPHANPHFLREALCEPPKSPVRDLSNQIWVKPFILQDLWKRKNIPQGFHTRLQYFKKMDLVRPERLELSRVLPHSDLNAARLPFRHGRKPINGSAALAPVRRDGKPKFTSI